MESGVCAQLSRRQAFRSPAMLQPHLAQVPRVRTGLRSVVTLRGHHTKAVPLPRMLPFEDRILMPYMRY